MGIWQTRPIKQIGKVVTGTTPSIDHREYYGGKIPFIRPAQLDKMLPVYNSDTYLSDKGASKAKIIPKNSVMVCCIGSVGKVGIVGKKSATNQQINSIIFDEKQVYPRYGFHYCKTLQPILKHMASSTTVAIVNKTRFENLQIPLPPLAEQQRIAAILDKTDSLRAKRRAALAKLDTLLQSVFLDMFGDPVTNPMGWEVVKLSDIADVISGVTKSQSRIQGKETVTVPYMRVANVQDGQILTDKENLKTIQVLPEDIKKYTLKPNDILLTEGGDPDKLGRGGIWKGEVTPCIYQNHIFRVRTNDDNIKPQYLSALIGSHYGKLYFLKAAKQTTGIASINKTQLRAFPVLCASIESQEKFKNYLKKLEFYKNITQTHLTHLDTLFHALQQRAFKGEL